MKVKVIAQHLSGQEEHLTRCARTQARLCLHVISRFRVNDLTIPTASTSIPPQLSNLHVHKITIATMSPIKKEKKEVSEFERKRLANIQANQAELKKLSKTADKVQPAPAPRPKPKTTSAPRKRAAPVIKTEARPTRTSSRLAGVEADSETAKRKAEVEYEYEQLQRAAKKMRRSEDLKYSDMLVEGKKYNKGEEFLSGIMKGAHPYVRTFTEDDIKETTDEGLKALREKMSGLELYEGYEPNRRCIPRHDGSLLTLLRNKNYPGTSLLPRLSSFT